LSWQSNTNLPTSSSRLINRPTWALPQPVPVSKPALTAIALTMGKPATALINAIVKAIVTKHKGNPQQLNNPNQKPLNTIIYRAVFD